MAGILPKTMIKRAAAAIANARGMRRGVPKISNVLDILGHQQLAELIDEAADALEAAGVGELLAAAKAQHDALDRLIARVITLDPEFRPSKSVIWPAVEQGHAAIKRAEGET